MEMAQQLMALGGMSNIEEAKQLLAVFNYDLNAAVASVLDGGAGPAAGADENAKGPLGAEFASLYEPKYGLLHPIFFNEDYEAAVRAGKSQGRIVCVYVYSDYEEDASDHFCKSVLSRAKLCDTLDESYIFYVCNQRKSSYVINKMMSLASEGGHSDKTMGHPFVAVIMPAIDSGSGDGGFVEPKMLSRMDNVFSADELVAQLDTHWQKYKPRLQDTQASFATIAADRQLKLQQDSELQEAMLMDKHRADTVKFEEAEKEMEQVMEASRKQAEADDFTSVVEKRVANGAQVPEEPPQGHKPAAKLQISLPDGTKLVRRFYAENYIQALYDFINAHDTLVNRPADAEFELVVTHSRKVIDNKAQTMKEADL